MEPSGEEGAGGVLLMLPAAWLKGATRLLHGSANSFWKGTATADFGAKVFVRAYSWPVGEAVEASDELILDISLISTRRFLARPAAVRSLATC